MQAKPNISQKNHVFDLKTAAFSRWENLCEKYLPVIRENSIWRLSREREHQEPTQGWKLHVSATVLDACNLFEKVAPFLTAANVQFKAPKSLDELSKINCGLQYGYHLIGKFITVYPSSETQAISLARQIHELTKDFFAISIPFDKQLLPGSSVFYRYGAFSKIEAVSENGKTFAAIKNPAGEFTLDDRFQSFPKWLSNPFQSGGENTENSFAETPLGTTYKIFSAITQRGKGGTYQAFDFSRNEPQLCIVKEGRRKGELGWNGQDGYFLVKNEFDVLKALKPKYDGVPLAFAGFETDGNFYLAMEFVEGKSLREIMHLRERRFSIKKVLILAIGIAEIIERIHNAGWIWNDCKPANLIVTQDKLLRPIDFEGAYPINQTAPFNWRTKGFSAISDEREKINGKSADIYALGAVVYFLLTGKLYDAAQPITVKKLRRGVAQKFVKIVERLLSDSDLEASRVREEFEEILMSEKAKV